MNDKCSRVSWLRVVTTAGLLVALSGCSEELGPERMVVTPVKGTVKEGEQPVSSGWIEFFPVEGTVGNLCSARIHPDGSFETRRAPVGVNLVRLVNVPLSSSGAKRVFGAYTSPIRRTVVANQSEPLVIDVVDEAILFQNPKPRGPGGQSRVKGESR